LGLKNGKKQGDTNVRWVLLG